ncbi:MAG: KamA family radical SAM protein [Victivallaceae bacterium]|nr:KamA family radical SAM protein [Victivallaceae bacterium]
MTEFFRTGRAAAEFLGIDEPDDWRRVEAVYPLLVNRHCLDLIDRSKGDADPVWRQFLPSAAELDDWKSDFDPLAEERQMLAPRLIRRFLDRAVVLVTGNCAVHCRFCFRKRLWKQGAKLADISDAELEAILVALREHPEIREVLLSGGDPCMVADGRLREIIAAFSSLEQISVIRLGTKLPAVWPERFTPQFIDMLAGFDKLWLLTHFNHPNEVDAAASAVCRSLIRRGVPVLNQCVLLRGVNDNPEVMEELFRRLLAIKVKPHYMFHVDPVRGVRHFATGIEAGLEVLRYLRGRLSSLGTPTFAIDLPEGGGKVALQPDYSSGGGFCDIHNKKIINYPDKEMKK